jgi:SulP family sulfate permease
VASPQRWTPELFRNLLGYRAHDFVADLIAGLTVGLMALPLAMAFAIASGVPPQAGIYTAVIAGFVISALGGSRVQIGGPTGAFVVIVAGIIAKFGVLGLLIVTVMAGAILIVMGLTGLGTAVKLDSPRHRRLHERHRHIDRLHADQRLSRASDSSVPSEFLRE